MVKIICDNPIIQNNSITDELVYFVRYRFSQPVVGVHDGGIEIPVEGVTETEANAMIQEAAVVRANLETSNAVNFTTNDVRGGRL
jgi:hypothetical protein